MCALSSHGRTLDVGRYGIDSEALPGLDHGPVDLRAWFAGHPDAATALMELEIGSGKGTFLIQQAPLSPGTLYLGIEYAKAFWRSAADRARRHNLHNVRVLHTEAGMFIRNYVADGVFRTVHVYFPDPWPKKRHHKRRLIQEGFLRELHRVITPGGAVRIATDHDDYFESMHEHAGRVTGLFAVEPFDSPDSAGRGELVGTNFERKYRREGRPFHAMVLRRLDAPAA